MVSYYRLMVKYGLSWLLYELEAFQIWVTSTLIFQGHYKVKLLDSQYTACYHYLLVTYRQSWLIYDT